MRPTKFVALYRAYELAQHPLFQYGSAPMLTTNHPIDADTLVNHQGEVLFGRFRESLLRVNGKQANYLTPMGQQASHLAQHFHYKQFQYFGLISQPFLIGCAFANTGWLGLVFVYVFDNETQQLHEWGWRSLLSKQLSLSDSPRDGESEFRKGKAKINMRYQQDGDQLIKSLSIDLPELQLNASLLETENFEPMSLCTRTGINGFTYANKVAGVAANGSMRLHGKTFDLSALNCFGHHDFTAGYLRRETWWNWACSSAEIEGHRVGFNLSCGVNETSFSENCLWLDDKLIPIGGVRFQYQRDKLLEPWAISDSEGHVKLEFHALDQHQEKLNLGLFASNFHQIFGHFSGIITLPQQTFRLDSIPGFVEEQYAKW